MAQGTLMAGRRGLVMGVANDRSIAWGIAKAAADQGAELAFTYQGEALGNRVSPLAASVGSDIVLPGDVTDEPSLDAVFETLASRWTFLGGSRPSLVDSPAQTLTPTGPAATEVHVSKPDGWPAGAYRVEIFADGRLIGTREFEVR